MLKRAGVLPTLVALLTALSTTASSFAATPTRPVAGDDKATLSSAYGVSIPVLDNDTSTDGTDVLRVHSIGTPKYGTATVGGKGTIIYRPGPNFPGYDTFRYSVIGSTGLTDSATVSVFSPRFAFAGPLAASIVDKDDLQVGYLRLDATVTGAFSGKVQIGTKHYDLVGSLDAKGRYVGYARDSDFKILAVSLRITQSAGETTLTGTFGGSGEWTVSQQVNAFTADGLKKLAGRYTVELPPFSVDTTGTTSSSGPEGSGWMTLKVNEQGSVRMEGRTGDGRSFSSSAQLAGTDDAATLPFLIADHSGALGGTLNVGDTVDGSLGWVLEASGDDLFPHGFDLTIEAHGARYIKPEDGRRALSSDSSDAGRVKITISGGGVEGFDREFKFTEDDEASVPEAGEDHVNIEIDRESGIFKGKFRNLNDRDKRLSFSGVIIQGEGRGAGVFQTKNKSGRVEVSVATSSSDDSGDDLSGDGNDTTGDGTDTSGTIPDDTGLDGSGFDASGGFDFSDGFTF